MYRRLMTVAGLVGALALGACFNACIGDPTDTGASPTGDDVDTAASERGFGAERAHHRRGNTAEGQPDVGNPAALYECGGGKADRRSEHARYIGGVTSA